MRLSKQLRLILVGTCTVALLLGATAAQATAGTSTPKPAAPGYFIINLSSGVQVGNATFYPTGHLPEGTIAVVPEPDGSLPATRTQLDQIVAAKARGDAITVQRIQAEIALGDMQPAVECHSYVAPYHAWSGDYTGGGVIGLTESARVTYSFGVTEGTNQQAAGQGLGYYYGYNGSDFGLWKAWYTIGTATSGENAVASLPWGESIGRAHFMAYSIALSLATGCFTP